MSIEKNSSLEWEDIEDLYGDLNTVLTKFSLANISVPENPNIALTSAISNLQSVINANINANSYLKNEVTQNSITVPSKNDIVKVLEFQSLKGTIEEMNGVCPHNASSHDSVCITYRPYTTCVIESDDDDDEGCSAGITVINTSCPNNYDDTPTYSSCPNSYKAPTYTTCPNAYTVGTYSGAEKSHGPSNNAGVDNPST